MKYVSFLDMNGRERTGIMSQELTHVFLISDLFGGNPDMIFNITDYSPEMHKMMMRRAGDPGRGIPLESVQLLAPIPRPRHDLLCIGHNYLEHAKEHARFLGKEFVRPERPLIFSKRVNRAVADGEPISAHTDITSSLDYETELAVIIGKRCDHVKPENAYSHVFGYTIANDVTARELQIDYGQYTFGKGLDGFAPMGPWIVTADEFDTPPCLRVQTRVNGETRQDSNTSDFIFDIPYLISEISKGIVLGPGDIILTGTPSGVGMGFDPPRFLKPGDVVECEIEGIGVLRNTVE